MRRILPYFILCLTFYQCSTSESNTPEQTAVTEQYKTNIDSTKFIVTELANDSDNVILLNEILLDTKYQVPYLYHYFYTIMDGGELYTTSRVEQESIRNQNKKVNKNHRFKSGDLKYYDTISNKIKTPVLIQTEQEAYNKDVIQLSRPYKLNDKEVIIFFSETYLQYKNNQEGPLFGGFWAVRFKKENGKWVQKVYYPGPDIS